MQNNTQKGELLIEIGTEELPPKALKKLVMHLCSSFEAALTSAQLEFDSIQHFATPRRLALLVSNLSARQENQMLERRGPSLAAAYDKDGEPSKALQGFLRSCDLDDVNQLTQQETKKGTWLIYKQEKTGQPIQSLLSDMLNQCIAKLPIERKMRWGTNRIEFVRPVHWLIALYDTEIVPISVLGITASNTSIGHRFMSSGVITISHPSKYVEALRAAHVIVDFNERRDIILKQLHEIAETEKAEIVIDENLLDEVTALVEWPVSLIGSFDNGFLKVPEEVLISAMKSHQRYFHLVDSKNHLLPKFVTVSNIQSKNPQSVISGNERVISPRLSDARFFFEQDKKTSLEEKLPRLGNIVFQSKLGTYLDKAKRVSKLAAYLATSLGADAKSAARAGLLCKTDLVSDMVGEFPELQGTMGQYYSDHDGEDAAVGEAIRDHYKPIASGAELPQTLIGQCVSIADKIDTLTGIFGIGSPPTGSKDPFALRRQTLGIIRICIENSLIINMPALLAEAISCHKQDFEGEPVFSYMLERLGTWYQDSEIDIDTYNAISKSAVAIEDFVDANTRVQALQAFRSHPKSAALVAANKRIANILKKVRTDKLPAIDTNLFEESAETALDAALTKTAQQLQRTEKLEDKFLLLAELQTDIDAFFDTVLVMSENDTIKQNRLAILYNMRILFLSIADFSILQ